MLEEYIINAQDFLINKIIVISKYHNISISNYGNLRQYKPDELFDIAMMLVSKKSARLQNNS